MSTATTRHYCKRTAVPSLFLILFSTNSYSSNLIIAHFGPSTAPCSWARLLGVLALLWRAYLAFGSFFADQVWPVCWNSEIDCWARDLLYLLPWASRHSKTSSPPIAYNRNSFSTHAPPPYARFPWNYPLFRFPLPIFAPVLFIGVLAVWDQILSCNHLRCMYCLSPWTNRKAHALDRPVPPCCSHCLCLLLHPATISLFEGHAPLGAA